MAQGHNGVEVGAVDEASKKQAEEILEELVRQNLHPVRGGQRYLGHVPEYSDEVWGLRDNVRKQRYTAKQLWSRNGKGWNPRYSLVPADDIERHNIMFGHRIHAFLAKHTSEGRPVIWITPVGPMGQYYVIQDLCRVQAEMGVKGIEPRLVHPFAMDEWSDSDGMLVSKTEYPHMTTFSQDMGEQVKQL